MDDPGQAEDLLALPMPAQCATARINCERRRMKQREEDQKVLAEQSAALERIEAKVDDVRGLSVRVVALERWKSELNGAAAEAAKHAQNHRRDGEERPHAHQRTIDATAAAVVKAMKESGVLGQPFDVGAWARANWKLVSVASVVVIFLAAAAGEVIRKMLEPPVKSAVERTINPVSPQANQK